MVSRVRTQLVNQGMDLEVTSEVKDLLANEGFDPQFGAR
ncbi:MAG: AAA family ATPase, partial [Armatimonadetes bacterium]|nr:AAA family ATPase [Armatimonadota bacterium]